VVAVDVKFGVTVVAEVNVRVQVVALPEQPPLHPAKL
jgi:hypothetical protein